VRSLNPYKACLLDIELVKGLFTKIENIIIVNNYKGDTVSKCDNDLKI
jgi:hypothetical protein